METCGSASPACLKRLAPLTNLFLFDFKETDPARHRAFTGADNGPILNALRGLHAEGCAIVLRCPIIPGLNDREDHFDGIARLWRELPGLAGVEIMAYHRLGDSKLERLGLTRDGRLPAGTPAPETVAAWKAALRRRGVPA